MMRCWEINSAIAGKCVTELRIRSGLESAVWTSVGVGIRVAETFPTSTQARSQGGVTMHVRTCRCSIYIRETIDPIEFKFTIHFVRAGFYIAYYGALLESKYCSHFRS